MDEGVSTVGPSHQVGSVEEPVLDWSLNEEAQSLLNVNKLQSMLSGNINSSLYKGEGCEGSTKLVDPVDQSPIPGFNEERKLL